MSCWFVAFLVLGLCFQTANAAGWGYEGAHGVDHWPENYPTCSGNRQSPIDVDTKSVQFDKNLGWFRYTNFDIAEGFKWILSNNGHTAVVTLDTDIVRVTGGGLLSRYSVAQFHFHWGSSDIQGSEHTLNGKSYPMEMHIVTWNRDYGEFTNALNYPDGLAVLGFFFEIQQEDNPTLAKLVNSLHLIEEPNAAVEIEPIALDSLLPSMALFFRYLGGLTTPPCSEVVIWTVFRSTIKISSAQMDAFRNLKSSEHAADGSPLAMVDNFRPPQPLMDRDVKTNFFL